MKNLILFVLAFLVGCGSGQGQPDTAVNVNVTQNQNNDSQNGDVSCEFVREPVSFDEQIVCRVTLHCEGAPVEAPHFENIPSSDCVTSNVARTDGEVESERVLAEQSDESELLGDDAL